MYSLRKGAVQAFEVIVDNLLADEAKKVAKGEKRIKTKEFQQAVKTKFQEELTANRGSKKHPETMFKHENDTVNAREAVTALVDSPEFKKWVHSQLKSLETSK